MPNTPFRPLVASLALAVLAVGVRGDPTEAGPPGVIQSPVVCADDPGQSYALYLPAGYTADRAWPIVFCFDPLARGRLAVERFQAAAERTGMIIAGSNNSRNGPWPIVTAAAEAMLRDTHRRLRLDDRRLYAAGFSGGARAACTVATARDFAGVVACGGGFPGSVVPPRVGFAFYGTAGRADFNYGEMRDVDAALESRGAAHRLAIFDGGHSWLPAPLAQDALEWLRLQATRSGRIPRDQAFLDDYFRRRGQAIAVGQDEGEVYTECLAAMADFTGLADTAGIAARAAALKNSRAVRQSLKAERKARAREDRWLERLGAAIAAARRPPPRSGGNGFAGQLRRDAGGDEPTTGLLGAAPGEPAFGSRPRTWAQTDDDWPPPLADADRYDEVRSLLRSLTRDAATDIAARRALEGAFVGFFEEARARLDAGQVADAARYLELAAIMRPEAPGVAFETARAAALRGDRVEACERLQAALAKGYRDDPRIEELKSDLGLSAPPVPSASPRSDLPPRLPVPQPTLVPGVAPAPAAARHPGPWNPTADAGAPVPLPAIVVQAKPVTSFGLSLELIAVRETKQILRVFVREVVPNSEADYNGLHPGTEILSIDGRAVDTFIVRFDAESDLGRLFVNRHRGDRVRLFIRSPGDAAGHNVELVVGRTRAWSPSDLTDDWQW